MIPIPFEAYHQSESPMIECVFSSSCPMGISQSPSPSQTPVYSYQSRMSECRMSGSRPRSKSGKGEFIKRKAQRNRYTMEAEDFIQFHDQVVPHSPHQEVDSALPSHPPKKGCIKYVTIDILLQCILRKLNCTIVDCRYPYEYDGGHVNGAVNVWNDALLFQHFPVIERTKRTNEILLFYCEYSGGRAPDMANKLRNADRMWSNGGDLIYKNIFIVDNGYAVINKQIPEKCTGGHLAMDASGYESLYQHYSSEAANCRVSLSKRKNLSLSHSQSLGSISFTNFNYDN